MTVCPCAWMTAGLSSLTWPGVSVHRLNQPHTLSPDLLDGSGAPMSCSLSSFAINRIQPKLNPNASYVWRITEKSPRWSVAMEFTTLGDLSLCVCVCV